MLHRGSTVTERQREGRIRKKLVVVGDGCCGKTAMLMIQSGLPFPTSYFPTIFENFVSSISVNGKLIDLSLWDTAGQEDYDRLRPLSYPCSDVIIMAYAVNNRTSFWSLNDKWKPEMNHFLPDVPKILVGLKKDLRHDPDVIEEMRALCTMPVSYEEGFKKAAEIGAKKYFECSAKTGEGVGEIFAYCAKLALLNKKNKAGAPCKVV
ncbi:hypothetical protein CcCBS67573_g05379 [Chytriomyces confervae]|uniref:Small monomeric GTPase n=1 Tax=Chytriomyces confervae TaxID=246404 RepID=A0A507FAJ2_9FUNG|nr:GTP-binding protein Rho1 [Chytriomyces hyalinus]TPX73351.1 hypothetical protein CcCBS67573_g05379 [Chytriomyces confervae]